MPAAKPSFPVLQRGQPLAQGLVADWPCYEGSGLTLDDVSGNQNSGTFPATGYSFTGGQSGWALLCASAGANAVTIPGIVSGTTFTIECSIFFNTLAGGAGGYHTILNANGSGLFVRGSGGLDYFQGSDHQAATTILAGAWYHLVVSCLAGALTFYINGVTDANTFAGIGSLTYDRIGSDAGSEKLDGIIDHLRVWVGRALTAADVAALNADPFILYRRRPWRLKATAAAPADTFPAYSPTRWAFEEELEEILY